MCPQSAHSREELDLHFTSSNAREICDILTAVHEPNILPFVTALTDTVNWLDADSTCNYAFASQTVSSVVSRVCVL